MHLNNIFLRSFRILLFPFAILYGLILRIRNLLYDREVIKSTAFNLPIIGVGNLSVGGTGKSPMVEYLIGILRPRYKIGTISRGYKRRTKGYLLADEDTTAVEIGDEPMQFYMKNPDIAVAVGEERIVAVPQLLYDRPETKVIILDDAFQHRAITPGFSILLTSFQDLYTRDFYLPAGNLRDNPSSACRANSIIVTKCPGELTPKLATSIAEELAPGKKKPVFFSTIRYGEPYHILTRESALLTKDAEVLLVCGIADPQPLTSYIEQHSATYDALFFGDHHIFTIDELRDIRKRFNELESSKKMIITTEKDAVRLVKFQQELADLPLFVLPISISFLFGKEPQFRALIVNFIENFGKNQRNNHGEKGKKIE